jgi:hypothetical protein
MMARHEGDDSVFFMSDMSHLRGRLGPSALGSKKTQVVSVRLRLDRAHRLDSSEPFKFGKEASQ